LEVPALQELVRAAAVPLPLRLLPVPLREVVELSRTRPAEAFGTNATRAGARFLGSETCLQALRTSLRGERQLDLTNGEARSSS